MSTASLQLPDPTGYDRLVGDGHYSDAPTGLWGKYDNVRRTWENQITRFAIRPALARIMRRLFTTDRGLRVADLGCGAGEGLDLLLKIPQGTEAGRGRYLIDLDDIASYHGIDLSPHMIAQARTRFERLPMTSFAIGDLADAAGLLDALPPFDLYYNSYGSLSHLPDEQLRRMIDGVLAHQPGPCTLMVDVHGQYSPEWPCYWNYSRDPKAERMQPYNMVWMYPEDQRAARLEEQRDYRVRYWRGQELRDFLGTIPHAAGRMVSMTTFDRSVLVGRHMDTGCFSPGIKPLRRAVNALFEFNQLSTPNALLADPISGTGDIEADAFFARYTTAWNAVVEWYAKLSAGASFPDPAELCSPGGPVPAALRVGMEALAEQARRLEWFDPGDPEANLMQPQFGLLLRQLEFHAQQGLGCGHGLLAVIEFSGTDGGV